MTAATRNTAGTVNSQTHQGLFPRQNNGTAPNSSEIAVQAISTLMAASALFALQTHPPEQPDTSLDFKMIQCHWEADVETGRPDRGGAEKIFSESWRGLGRCRALWGEL
jgi:hypothetical protein